MITILTVVLTDEEREAMASASWACFSREANRRVGVTLARLLTEGIVVPETDEELAEFVAEQSGVEQVTDTEVRALLALTLADIMEGMFPRLTPDWLEDA